MRAASAALVPTLALAAAGCGDRDSRPREVRSASFRYVAAIRGFGSCTGRGVFDFERQLGALSMDCSKLGAGRVRLLEVGDHFYFGGEGSFTGRKRWIRSRVNPGPQNILGYLGGFDPFRGRDPSEMLSYLRSQGRGVSTLGSETVRGTAMTRYGGTLPGPRGEKLTISVWADSDGTARRIRTRYPSGAPLTVTVDLVRFGIHVTTTVPPRSTVMTAAEYQTYARKQVERGAGGLLHLYGDGEVRR